MPGWAEFLIERAELDLSYSSAEPFKTKALQNRIELLKRLDDGFIKSRKALGEQLTSTSKGLGASLWEVGFCSTHRNTGPSTNRSFATRHPTADTILAEMRFRILRLSTLSSR